mgnify:CR=1 FL=1
MVFDSLFYSIFIAFRPTPSAVHLAAPARRIAFRAASALAATANVTSPEPVPEALVIVSHDALEDAVQVHDGSEAVTVSVPVPASDP